MKNLIFTIATLFVASLNLQSQTVRVNNMMPATLSNETNQDGEPNIAVNPNNPNELIGTAFTPNPTGATATAPIFISQDGGANWVLNNIVPSGNGMTGDITVGLSRNNVLYAGTLRGGAGLTMDILRSNNYTTPSLMTTLVTRTNEDQPYVEAITPLLSYITGNDRVYVGHNDFNPGPRTASIEQSLDATNAVAPAGLAPLRLEARTTAGQDGPPIRTSVHPNGTVYAIFDRITTLTNLGASYSIVSDIVVSRDDDWGQGATPYTDLVEPTDLLPGRLVATGLQWTFNSGSVMGQERLADRASIAVNPVNSNQVYIAYIDRPGTSTNTMQIHVRRSDDGGNNWTGDIMTIADAINPQLAVSIRGTVGLAYQQLTGVSPNQVWESHFQQSNNAGTTWVDFRMHSAPSNVPTRVFGPYLGDYLGLKAVGKDFYGIFSGNNTPSLANFPQGITYQRNVNFGTQRLRNLANTADVNISIDPFFFSVQQILPEQDFFVRDWTTTSTVFDTGLEPSTNPVFYATSDIWNRRVNSPGTFNVSDQADNQDPQIASLGNNFAYARVHRKGAGTAETVNLHFLKSEFGTGSNYVDANTTSDPTLIFAAGSTAETMATGYQWTLGAIGSTHVCLAVEISTTNDPLVVPSLVGRAPGWPTTDLSVIYDNNKAQRNLGVVTTLGGGIVADIPLERLAIVHNGAPYRRDVVLRFFTSKGYDDIFKHPGFRVLGINPEQIKIGKNEILFKDMMPGENRWLEVSMIGSVKEKSDAFVTFQEMVDGLPINGFTIAVEAGGIEEVIADSKAMFSHNLRRIGAIYQLERLDYLGKLALEEIEGKPESFLQFYKKYSNELSDFFGKIAGNGKLDPFNIYAKHKNLLGIIKNGEVEKFQVAIQNFNEQLDAHLTMVDKRTGDLADILQNVTWMKELMEQAKFLSGKDAARSIVNQAKEFEQAFAMHKASYKDYPQFIGSILSKLEEIVSIAKSSNISLSAEYEAIKAALDDPKHLQKAHLDFLMRLEGLK